MAVGDRWNDWSLKVLEELTTLNARQEQLTRDFEETKRQLFRQFEETKQQITKNVDDKDKIILEKLENVSELLNGNGSPEKGIIVRLDRIEQNEQRRTWLLRTTIVASVGAILSTLASWFKNP